MPFPRDAPSAPPPRRRYYVYGIGAILFGLIGGILIAEIGLRQGRWKPPRQLVRGFGLHSRGGVPVWEQATDRQNRACVEQHPERTRILFFGSSITFGTSLNAAEAFTTALEARLNEARPTPGFCVLNFAQPGFAFEQKYAVARVEVPRYQPALIMWESWVEWPEYRLIGDAAYGIGNLRVRDDGFIGMRGVPDRLNRLLFLNSRLYQYVVLTFGEQAHLPPGGPHGVVVFADQRLSQVPPLAQSVGAKLVMYLAPPLDQPFSETDAVPPDWHGYLLDFARSRGVPMYMLQHELVDQDYLALRMDPCCHYNAAGHRALVPVMERIILEQLDPSVEGGAPSPPGWLGAAAARPAGGDGPLPPASTGQPGGHRDQDDGHVPSTRLICIAAEGSQPVSSAKGARITGQPNAVFVRLAAPPGPRLFAEQRTPGSGQVARHLGVPRLVEVHGVVRRDEGEAEPPPQPGRRRRSRGAWRSTTTPAHDP